ncbi:hypothetical protein HDU77_008246, partial [Chytriomyces hyalinus]
MQLAGILSSLLLATQALAIVRRGAPADAPTALKCAFVIDFEQGADGHAILAKHLAGKGLQWSERTSVSNKYANFVSVQLVGDCQDAATIFQGLSKATSFAAPGPQPLKSDRKDVPFSDELYHSITGVNDARNKLGLTGKGITVAIIDSGIYYLHPALGGGIGKGFKVLGGYDLVGDDYSIADPTITPDDDPIDNCSNDSHGTHVAGIVAADARNITTPGYVPAVPFTGVAYEANILAYRVFGCPADSTASDVMAAAIYRAADDGADVINLSIGGGPDYPDEVDTIAAEVVGKAGHFVLASAGNSGAKGLQVTGNPSNSNGGFSVASFDNTVTPLPYSLIDGESYFYGLGSNNGSFVEGESLDIVVNDITADDNNIQNDGATNINPAAKGKALLLRWGSTTEGGSSKRCGYALAAGATRCILYGNTEELVGIAGNAGLPSMFLSREGGLALIAKVKAGGKPSFTFTSKQKPFNIPTAGTISDFSSPGLSLDLEIKPDFGGLGGQVYSTMTPSTTAVTTPTEPTLPVSLPPMLANLLAYRVFGCPADSTASDVMAAAIYRAADDGADVINLSIGGGPDYPDEVDTIAAEVVGKAGHFVLASAGNSGAKGIQVTGNPSNSNGGFSVASFDNTVTPLPYSLIDGESYFYGLGSNNGSFVEGESLDIVVNDITADDNNIQNDGATNINPAAKGKALLLRWGSTTEGGSSKRCGYALAAGATRCILYGNTEELVGIAGNAGLPSMFLSREGGLALIAKVKAGGKPSFTFTSKQKPFNIPTAGTISDFSSPGLSLDLEIKPDFGGLGGQ